MWSHTALEINCEASRYWANRGSGQLVYTKLQPKKGFSSTGTIGRNVQTGKTLEIERQKTETIHEQTQSFTVCGTQQLTHKPAFSEARPRRSETTMGPPSPRKPYAPLQKTVVPLP